MDYFSNIDRIYLQLKYVFVINLYTLNVNQCARIVPMVTIATKHVETVEVVQHATLKTDTAQTNVPTDLPETDVLIVRFFLSHSSYDMLGLAPLMIVLI